jgi:hypothetical protein
MLFFKFNGVFFVILVFGIFLAFHIPHSFFNLKSLSEGKTKNVLAGATHSDEVLRFFAATLYPSAPIRAEQHCRPVHHERRVLFDRPLPAATPPENPS